MKALWRRWIWILGLLVGFAGPGLRADTPADLGSIPLRRVQEEGILRLNELKGKVVIVNFWATWCPPCLEEIPALISFQKEYAERGVVVVGVDHMERPDREKLQSFAKEQEINYPLVYGTSEEVNGLGYAMGGIYGLPTSKVLDREGKVVRSHTGRLNRQMLENLVRPLLSGV
ncbi:MAG: TlpA family protein disulfide reductase [Magnetococcales bacterium]|nr:TlpA family protein disulfide reductase [Magnetococcales bacterium]